MDKVRSMQHQLAQAWQRSPFANVVAQGCGKSRGVLPDARSGYSNLDGLSAGNLRGLWHTPLHFLPPAPTGSPQEELFPLGQIDRLQRRQRPEARAKASGRRWTAVLNSFCRGSSPRLADG